MSLECERSQTRMRRSHVNLLLSPSRFRPSHVRLLADKVPVADLLPRFSTRFYVSAVELRSWELSAARPTHKFIAPGQICLPIMSVRSIRSFWFSSFETTLLLDTISRGPAEKWTIRVVQYLLISCNFFLFILITHLRTHTLFKIERKISFFSKLDLF